MPALSIINTCLRGLSANLLGMDICTHESNSRISWSNSRFVLSNSLTMLSGVSPGTLISAAQPLQCWLVGLLPTAVLNSGDL